MGLERLAVGPLVSERVSVFFVGIGKCGTSWIYETSKRTGLLSTPTLKEPFIVDQEPAEQTRLLKDLYDNALSCPMADFSNLYFLDENNPEKICEYNPQAKIVITVRKPSERIESQFGMLLRNGLDSKISLAEYLSSDELGLIERSRYRPIVERYMRVFGPDKVLILSLEMLRSSPQLYMDRLCEFLELESPLLSDKDKLPVLVASKPRNVLLARYGKRLSLMLRKHGYYKSLGWIKNSSVVSKLIYKPVAKKAVRDFGPFADEIKKLDDDYLPFLSDTGAT